MTGTGACPATALPAGKAPGLAVRGAGTGGVVWAPSSAEDPLRGRCSPVVIAGADRSARGEEGWESGPVGTTPLLMVFQLAFMMRRSCQDTKMVDGARGAMQSSHEVFDEKAKQCSARR